jgi:cysteine desulfurase
MKLWSKLKPGRIYADAAASTPLSPAVKAELMRLIELFGNPSALHQEAVAAKNQLEGAREKIATILFAHPEEIIFTSGGTEANNLAIFGALRGKAGAHAITTAIEHSSVLEPLRALQKDGLEVTELPVDAEGKIDLKTFRGAIRPNTVFVSLQMINSEIGTIQNIREVAKAIRKSEQKIILHVDASQAPLWLPLHVERLGLSLLTLDAQKMMGPKGVGVLYAKRGITLTPLIYGGGQEAGRRSGTENVLLAGAMAVALEEAQKDADSRAKEISKVRDYLIEEIKKVIPGAKLHGAGGEDRIPNNINMYLPGLNGDMAVVALDAEGVAISTRSACDIDDEAPSHVLEAIGVSPDHAKESIRITLLPDATRGEARRIAKILSEVYARYSQSE